MTAEQKQQKVKGEAKPAVAEGAETTKQATPDELRDKAALSAFQLKERKKRTVFVGNVPVDATAKQLQKVFRACGKIEKIWFRSICVEDESKKPQRAKIINKDFGNFKDSKNAYVLYKELDSVVQAKERLN